MEKEEHTPREDSDSDDDGSGGDGEPKLSAHAMAALQEFLAEKQAYKAYEDSLFDKTKTQEEAARCGFVADLKEDWQLSQFWYTEETSEILAQEALEHSNGGKVACVSTPSVFKALKKKGERLTDIYLLEYDKRFACYGDQFCFYDFNHPHQLPADMRHAFDFVMVDPPFLNADCMNKFLDTVEYLSKDGARLLILSGLKVEGAILERLGDKVLEMVWRPMHEGSLQNEFRCWANYKSPALLKSNS